MAALAGKGRDKVTDKNLGPVDGRGHAMLGWRMERCGMKPGDLSLHLEAYLALKKALGFSTGISSWRARKAATRLRGIHRK
jgi:hypothetical protein